MNRNELYDLALKIAIKAHEVQKDKSMARGQVMTFSVH